MNKQKELDEQLIEASADGHVDVVKVLLAAGADVHARGDHALRSASRNGHIDVVNVLLTAGANVHACDDHALLIASYFGYADVVLALAEHAKLSEQQAQKWYDMIVEHSKKHQLLICVLPLITRWMKV